MKAVESINHVLNQFIILFRQIFRLCLFIFGIVFIVDLFIRKIGIVASVNDFISKILNSMSIMGNIQSNITLGNMFFIIIVVFFVLFFFKK